MSKKCLQLTDDLCASEKFWPDVFYHCSLFKIYMHYGNGIPGYVKKNGKIMYIFSTKYLPKYLVLSGTNNRCKYQAERAHLKYVGLTPRVWTGESNSSTSNGADDNVAS